MLITHEMIIAARTKNGAFTGLQLEMVTDVLGIKGKLPIKGWPSKLVCTEVTPHWWESFYAARLIFKKDRKRLNKKKKVINSFSTKQTPYWKPQPADIPVIRRKGDGMGVDESPGQCFYAHLMTQTGYPGLKRELLRYLNEQAELDIVNESQKHI